MKSRPSSVVFVKSLLIGLCCLFCWQDIQAQTLPYGPMRLRVRVTQVFARSYQDVFSSAEQTWRVWVRDITSLDGQDWRGNPCIQRNVGSGSFPYTSPTFATTLMDHSYTGSNIPQFYQKRMDAWEDDSDELTGCGNRCDFNTCGFFGDDDDARCNTANFAGNIAYLNNGIAGVWNDDGMHLGCGSAYGFRTQSLYEYLGAGNNTSNPIVLGSSTGCLPVSFSANGNNVVFSNNYTGAFNQASGDVFYRFTLSSTSDVSMSTCGGTTNFNTYLHLLNGSGSRLLSNDNDASCPNGTNRSLINATNLAPGTYYIVVEGAGTNRGDFTLNVDVSPEGPVANISGLPASMCLTDAPASLSGSPGGGSFSGPGVSGSSFDPGSAGVGTHTVTYTVPGAGTDYGYSTLPHSPVSGTGTSVSLADNSISGGINLGFNFDFYGNNYSQVRIGSNGFLTFSAGQPSGATPQTIPNTTNPDNLIAAAWNDLDPQQWGSGGVYYRTIGSAPNRRFIVDFVNVPSKNNGTPTPNYFSHTFQYILYENTSEIDIHLSQIPANGRNKTLGVENQNGTSATPVINKNNSNWSVSNQAWRFSPSCAQEATATVTVNPLPNANFSGLANSYCPTSAPVTLVPSVAGGVFSGPGVSGTTFNPAAANAGTNTITYTLSQNGCVNSSTQSTTILSPPNVSVTASNASCPNINDGSLTATGSGGSPPYSFAWSNGGSGSSISGLAAGSYTVTITDNSGCINTGSGTVGVNPDQSAPTLTCPANIVTVNDPGVCGAVVTFATPNASDNCDPNPSVVLNSGPSSGSVFPLGNTTVTFTATDASGNSTNCSFMVSVGTASPSTNDFVTNGNAVNTGGLCYRLTQAANSQFGTVWYQNRLTLANDFCLEFDINLGNQNGGADGMAFVLQPLSTGAGSSGGGLGYQGINPSVAVEFDTYQNGGFGDPFDDHIGIQRDGNISHSTGAITPPVTVGNIEDGLFHRVRIDWNAASNQLDVYFDNSLITSATQNLTSTVFGGNPNVFWGWTGATGGLNNQHEVCMLNLAFSEALEVALAATDESCLGVNDGSVDLSPTGGIPPYTYAWSNGATSQDLTNVGPGTYTVTVSDVCGTTTVGSATVATLPDVTLPVISCPANITLGNDPGLCAAMVSYTAPIGTDNCPGVATSLGAGLGSGATFPLGTTSETYTATDLAGNTATCSFTITVNDTENPQITCPANISVNNDPGLCGANVAYSVVASDNCPGVSSSLTMASGSFFPVGTTTVWGTATDQAGNTATCNFMVSVVDNENPSIVCPADTTVSANANCAFTLPNLTVPSGTILANSVVDFSGIQGQNDWEYGFYPAFQPQNFTQLNPANFGPIWFGSEAFGTAFLDPNGGHPGVNSFAWAVRRWTSTYTGLATIAGSFFDRDLNCGDGANVRILVNGVQVYDFQNIPGTATNYLLSVPVNAGDVIDFAIDPRFDTGCDDTQFIAVITSGTGVVANDNCGIAGINSSPAPGSVLNVGPTPVTLTAVDQAGNSSSCTFNVNVIDDTAPVAICQDITVQLDASGNATITPSQINNNSTDNCAIASLSLDNTSFTCTNVGSSNTVTLTVTDVNSNSSSCTATVTIEDNVPPVAVCQDITVQLDASGNASITPSQINNNSTDNCAIASLSLDNTSFTCTNVGSSNTVTLTVTDVNSNSSTCTATVTIEDNVPPVAICQDITVQLDAFGNASITPSQINNNSTDNCAIASLSLDVTTFNCSSVSASGNVVTLTVTDVNSNSSTCTATVTIEDNVLPVAICQDITVQLDASGNATITPTQINNNSTDNCAIASLSLDNTAFNCSSVSASGNVVTLTVTDVNSNSSTCTATVTIEDNVPPVAICQDITVQLDASGNATITPSQINNNSTDNCGIASLSLDVTTFNCSSVSASGNVVTLTVTDVNSNSSTCTSTVTIEDNVPPVAICQDITVQLDASGNATITPSQINNNSTDNCGIASLSLDNTSFTCTNVGSSNTVTLTVTDVNSNSSTCTATVTIEDNVPPVAICQDITVQLDASGNGSITPSQINNNSTDNCGIALLSLDNTAFTCTNVGSSNTVTLTVTDVNSNSSSCTATVTIEDNVPPVAVCQDITVQLDASGNASITPSQINNNSTDNCAIASLSLDNTAFTCTNVGSNNTVTLTVTDVNSNSSTCTATVTIEDNVPPVAICQDITVQLDASGNASITPSQINSNSTDNCAIASLSLDNTAFTCTNVGSNNTVTLTVTDVNSNSSSCTAIVTVEDNVPPVAICQDITIQLDASGNATITPAQINNNSTDNCAIASLSLDNTAFNCSSVSASGNVVTLTVTDVNSNSTSCTATVTIEDNVPPVAICQDITVQLDASGNASITPSQINNNSTDNCAIASLSLDVTTFNCSSVSASGNVVTLTVTDVNSNNSTCTATVTVEDNVPPMAICQDITVQLDASGNATITPGQVNNNSTDNCAIASLSLDNASFTCTNVGSNNTVTLTVTDVNSNSSTCTATVTIEDNVPPVAICQDIAVQLDASGNASITPAQINNNSTDNCAIASLSLDNTSFTCTNVGSNNTVTLTVTDVNSNSSSCTAIVTVEDNVPPVAICQDITIQLDASGNATITPSQINNNSTDNCAIASLSLDNTAFTCTNVGSNNTVTLTVTDVNSNSSTCTATVTIEDNVPPVAICQDITVQLDASGNATITPAQINNNSTDNCAIASLSLDNTSFTCTNVGSNNTVTLTVTDVNSNSSSCTATVTIEDNVPPVAVCQDITVQLDASGNASITPSQINNNSTDNCAIASLSLDNTAFTCTNVGSNNTVTLTVTDVNSNSSSCTAIVTVEDNVPPVAICQDITVQLDASGNASITPSQINNNSTDNCGIASLSLDNTSFTCTNVGSNNTVTLTVTDVNSNSSSCTATITVEDNVPPVAICQDITIQLDASGNATITPSQINNNSTDNCAIASLSLDNTAFNCSSVSASGNVVTLTVTDVNSNSSTCTATVTIEDNVPPVAICQDITVQLDASGNASITPSQINNNSTDNCAIASLSLDVTTFNCSSVSASGNVVTLTVTDVNSNNSTCTATVTVEDNVPPMAICQDIIVQLDASGNATITPGQVNNNSTDNCAIASLSLDNTSFTCTNVGSNNTVTLTVTDVNSNSSTCTATVTIEDNVPPIAICQDITIQLDASGNASITPSQINNNSTDNCAIASLSLDNSSFTCTNVGSNNTVTLTVTDVNFNSSSCTATITVEDNVPPVAVCQDITVQLDTLGFGFTLPALINNGSNDACGLASLVLDDSTFGCADLGLNTVTLTVTDNNGNQNTCTATVTVEDTLNPFVICPANVSVSNDLGQCAAQVNIPLPQYGDNCSVVFIRNDYNGLLDASDTYPVGTTTVMYLVRDSALNGASCTFEVEVLDTENPVISCPSNLTVNNDPGDCGALVMYPVPVGNDNCSGANTLQTSGLGSGAIFPVGTTTESYQVTDSSGNTASCSFNVTVLDNQFPVLNCPANVVVSNDTGQCGAIVTYPQPTFNDNCPGVSLSQTAGLGSGSFFPVGVNTEEYEVNDASGNTVNCSFTITVNDTEAPGMTCPGDITVNTDASLCQAAVSVPLPQTGDNCGVASYMNDFNMGTDASGTYATGITTVTYMITDIHGNSNSCTFRVTVIDNEAPSITCPANTVTQNTSDSCNTDIQIAIPMTGDNCGVASLINDYTGTSDASGSYPVGITTVTYTVSDTSGNTTTCSFTVQVIDIEAPTLDPCPANIVVVADSSDCDPPVSWTPPTVLDNCGPFTLVASHQPGDEFPVGTTQVSYIATDSSGNADSCLFSITVNPRPLVVQLTPSLYNCGSNVSCNGASDGNVTSYVSGGCLPYSYAWSNGAATSDIQNLSAGSYSVTVSDANGQSAVDSVVIFEPTPVSATAIVKSADCKGNNDGAINLAPTGGCPTYTYLWSNGATTQDLQNLAAGMYSVTITDANGCTGTFSANVTEPDALTASLSSATYVCGANISCNGASDGNITTNILGGTAPYTYQWSTGATSAGISGLSAGTYSLTVTDVKGCMDTVSINLTEPQPLGTSVSSPTFACGTNISCAGAADGSIDLNVSGGADCQAYSFSWSNGASTEDIQNLSAGTYTVTVTDANGCSETNSITLTEPQPLSAAVSSPTFVCGANVSCNGAADGSIDLSVSGGADCQAYAFVWSNGATTEDLQNLSAGSYSVTITDANGCSETNSITLTEPQPLSAAVSSPTFVCGANVSCNGAADGSIDLSVSGGADCQAYAFVWSNGATTEDLQNLSAGSYSVTITDANGCSVTSSITLTEPQPLSASLSSPTFTGGANVSCAGASDGSIDLSVSGGAACQAFSFVWSNGATSEDIQNLSAGTYTVTVSDANGCSATASITLTEPQPLGGTVTAATQNGGSNLSCNGANGNPDGEATATISGGTPPYTYLWSDGQTTQTAVNLAAGTYTVTATDVNGCIFTGQVTLTEPDTLIASVVDSCITTFFGYSPDECANLQAGTVSGGTAPYTYSWSNGDSGPVSQICPSTSTTYFLTVTDANGCTSTDSVRVNVIDARCGNNNNKVVLCHYPPGNPNNPQQLCISANAVPAHVNAGQGHAGCHVGPCGAVDPCTGQPLGNSNSTPICTGNNLKTIDFNYDGNGNPLPAGTQLDSQYVNLGVTFTFDNARNNHPDVGLIFDSANPTGTDVDLGCPNADFGGPGIGNGGEQGNAGENNQPMGNLMIIAENIVDNDNNGLVDDPDDEARGGEMHIHFATPTDVADITLVDLDDGNGGNIMVAQTTSGTTTIPIPDLGDNSVKLFAVNLTGVTQLTVVLEGSGAVGRFSICDPGSTTPAKIAGNAAQAGAENESQQIQTVTGSIELAAFPNPFNRSTTLRFSSPKTDDIRVEVFSLTGEWVATVFNGRLNAGESKEVEFTPESVSDGVYIAKLITGAGETRHLKLVLIK